jgi:hypothetical protein
MELRSIKCTFQATFPAMALLIRLQGEHKEKPASALHCASELCALSYEHFRRID